MSNTFVDSVPDTNSIHQNPTINIGPVQQNIVRFPPQGSYKNSEDKNLCPTVTSLLDLYKVRKTNGRMQGIPLLDLYAACKTC